MSVDLGGDVVVVAKMTRVQLEGLATCADSVPVGYAASCRPHLSEQVKCRRGIACQ